MIETIKDYLKLPSLDILKFSEMVDIKGVNVKSAGFSKNGEYWNVYYKRKLIGKTHVDLSRQPNRED